MKNPLLRPALMLALLLAVLAVASPTNAAMTADGQMIIVPEYVKAEEIVKNGDFESAIPLLNETLRQYPAHASAWNLLGYIHRRLGKFDEAEQYYEGALTLNPNHIGALNYMGQLFLQTGRPDKANILLSRLKEICTDGCEELDHLQTAIDTGVAGNY